MTPATVIVAGGRCNRDQLVTAVGAREQAVPTRSAAAEDRMRVFNLCTRAYDHARRALLYLRYEEDDADEHIPSLYAGRAKRRVPQDGSTAEPSSNDETEDESVSDEEEASPLQANGAPGAPARVGLPNSNPFTE